MDQNILKSLGRRTTKVTHLVPKLAETLNTELFLVECTPKTMISIANDGTRYGEDTFYMRLIIACLINAEYKTVFTLADLPTLMENMGVSWYTALRTEVDKLCTATTKSEDSLKNGVCPVYSTEQPATVE